MPYANHWNCAVVLISLIPASEDYIRIDLGRKDQIITRERDNVRVGHTILNPLHPHPQIIERARRAFALAPAIVVDGDDKLGATQRRVSQEMPVAFVEEIENPGTEAYPHVSLGERRTQSLGSS